MKCEVASLSENPHRAAFVRSVLLMRHFNEFMLIHNMKLFE